MIEDQDIYMKRLKMIQALNPFDSLLEMKVAGSDGHGVEVNMPVIADKHTNLYNVAHGGSLAALADAAMGMSCALAGKRVVTMEMNMNFIKGAVPQAAVRAVGRILHDGRHTIVTVCDIFDGDGDIVATGRGTYFVVGPLEQQ